jgi:cytidylate kinase
MYRAIALAAISGRIDLTDQRQLEAAVEAIEMDLDSSIVRLGDEDVTARLRTSDVTDAVSAIAAQPMVRAALVPLQKELARDHDVVVEGRDIGTVVFPDAEVKIYLTASAQERVRRRMRQLGDSIDGGTLEDEIRARDTADASRALSPLQQAPEAHRIDSTEMTLDEVTDAIVELVTRCLEDGPE